MDNLKFRKLTANEIDCRIATVTEKGLSLLLYKDARCDMNILDEAVGPMNWQRSHTRENANCVVSIWDDKKGQWISKEDTGTESFTEKVKGLASDSFKRACFNWGIGRELYTAPFIWISAPNCTIEKVQQAGKSKYTSRDRYYVSDIGYNKRGVIDQLEIKHGKTHAVAFSLVPEKDDKKAEKVQGKPAAEPCISEKQIEKLMQEIDIRQVPESKILNFYHKQSFKEFTQSYFDNCMELLKKYPIIKIPNGVEGEVPFQ